MDKDKNKDIERTAKAFGRALPISTKHSIEICNFIRYIPLQKAKSILKEVADGKRAIPFKRFTEFGHRRGMAAGKYPKNASEEILALLESVEANAKFLGMSTENLVISELIPNKASRPWRYGRHRRRKAKRTNIDIVVKEAVIEKKEKKTKESKK